MNGEDSLDSLIFFVIFSRGSVGRKRNKARRKEREKCARAYVYLYVYMHVCILCVYYGKDGSEYHVAT